MNIYFTCLTRPIPFFVIFLCTLFFSCADQLNNSLYAQTYPTQPENSNVSRETASNSPSNVLSEFFLGKRNAEAKSRMASTQSNSPNKEQPNSKFRQNSDYNVTLKKFFGLTPRKDSIMKANIDVHPDSFSQGLPIEKANVEQFVGPVESTSEEFINGISRFSDETVQEFDTVRRRAERHVQNAHRSVDKTAQVIQNKERQYAYNIQDQFQGVQKAVENKAFDVGRQGRQIAYETKNYVTKGVDDAIDATSKNVRKLRQETNNLLSSHREYNVDSILQENQERIAKARRQRLEELNAILSEYRPEERALPKQRDRNQVAQNESNLAQANRSMIRQASNIEPSSNSSKRLVSKSRLQERGEGGISKSTLNKKASKPQTAIDLQESVMRTKKNRAKFVEPSTSGEEVKDDCLKNDDNEYTEVSNAPRDVIKNGVIRSSAKFIDPKDL